MKKICAVLLALIVAMSIMSVVALADGATPEIVVVADKSTVKEVGEIVNVSFVLKNASYATSVAFGLSCDGFEFVSGSESYPDAGSFMIKMFMGNKLTLSGCVGGIGKDSATILSVQLKATAVGDTTISVNNASISDANYNKYTPSVTPATITHEHTYGEKLVADATCTVPAQYIKECTVEGCDVTEGKAYAKDDVLAPHTEKTVAGYPAECGKAGLTDGKVCSVCEKTLVEQTEIEALKHTGGTATCTEKAICDLCGEAYGELAAHVYAAPTFSWSEDGTSATYTTSCTTCTTETITDNATVKQTAGDAGDCLTKGTYTYEATAVVAGQTYTDTKTVSGVYGKHDTEHVKAVEATCVAAGNVEHYHCDVCGKYFTEEACNTEIADVVVAINANNHKNVSHTDAVAATCVKEGNVEYWSCADCGKNYSDEACTTEVENVVVAIDSTNHTNLKGVAEVPGTCAETGTKAYWHCDGCNLYYADAEATTPISQPETIEKDPANHTNLKGVAEKPATCTETGTKAYWYCDGCDLYYADAEATTPISQPEIIEKNGDNHDCYDYDENGHWTTCGEENGESLEHKFNEETVGNKKVYTCVECGYSYYKTVSGSTGATSPKTGDEANIALWAVVFVVSGAGVVALTRKKKEN